MLAEWYIPRYETQASYLHHVCCRRVEACLSFSVFFFFLNARMHVKLMLVLFARFKALHFSSADKALKDGSDSLLHMIYLKYDFQVSMSV